MQRLIVPLVLLCFLASCNISEESERGNGKIVTKKIPVENFNSLEISGSFDVILQESDSVGLVLTTDENLHGYIKISNNGGALKIKADKNLKSTNGVDLKIFYTDLSAIESSGASTIENSGVLAGDDFKLNISGAGAVKISIEVDQLIMNISGAGSIEIDGKVREQAVKMSGAGGLDALDLQSEYAKIDITGVGGAKVYVTKKLDASVSGVGGITYRGDPKEIKKDISGLGSVDPE